MINLQDTIKSSIPALCSQVSIYLLWAKLLNMKVFYFPFGSQKEPQTKRNNDSKLHIKKINNSNNLLPVLFSGDKVYPTHLSKYISCYLKFLTHMLVEGTNYK